MAISSKAPRLEAGDLVRVRSGGPNMTAARVDYQVQRPYARCAWVDARGTFRFVSIDIAALELVDPDNQQTSS
jgi:uncharacterized protein YodC (DUF2158 family)